VVVPPPESPLRWARIPLTSPLWRSCMHAHMNEYQECILYEVLGCHEEMLMLGMVTYTFFKT
jgi:hypothetical protein